METERPRMTRSKAHSSAAAAAAAEPCEAAPAPSAPDVNGEVAEEIGAPSDPDKKVVEAERTEDEGDKGTDVQGDEDADEEKEPEEGGDAAVESSPETKKKEAEPVEDESKEEKSDKDVNVSQKQSPEAPETPTPALGRGRRSKIANIYSVHGSGEDGEKQGESIKTVSDTKPKLRGKKRKVAEVPEPEAGDKDVSEGKEKDEGEASSQGTEEHNESLRAESIGSMDSDLDLPPKQTLGKGKRARIPNRRYGDITLTPKTTVTENGSEKIKSDNESLDFSVQEESSGVYTSGTISLSPSGNTPQTKKLKYTNLKDPKYMKPFEYGWKRELVFRGTSDSKLRRNADVYYFSPDKKKVRSMREVVENLKNKALTVDNFTFFKEAIGVNDPDKEIIRSALKRTSTPTLPEKKVAQKAEPVAKGRKTKSPSQKAMSTQVSTPKVASPKVTLIDEETPELKVKLPTKRSVKKVEKEEETTEAVTTPSRAASTKTPSKAANFSNMEDKPRPPCSIRCEGVRGLVPTLQCSICLCLYHYECVGWAPHLNTYVCKKCRQDRKPIQSTPLVAPPPLTPINSLKPSSAQSATNLTALPKLQRIPKAGDPPPSPQREEPPVALPPAPLPSPPPPPPAPSPPPREPSPCPAPRPLVQPEPAVQVQEAPPPAVPPVGHQSIVGSVTTWLPQNAKIVDQVEEASEVPRPQYVEYLNGRKFLVIPKHNFMSVSPGLAATAGVTRPLAGLTGADVETAIAPVQPEPSFPSNPENSQTADAMDVDHVKRKAAAEDDADATDTTAESRSAKRARLSVTTVPTPPPVDEKSPPNSQPDNHFQNLAYGYNTLVQVFQYLKVQDLLRAGCVCTMWRDVMSNPTLWKTVRMKNSQVHSFEGLANTLKKHCTKHLDLRKVLLPNGGDEIWPEFSTAIEKVDTLRKIELCRCPAAVVEKLAVSNPQLEVVNAVTIKCETLDLTPFNSLTEVKELRLKSTTGFTISSNLDSLKEMKSLVHLSLTSVKELDKMNLSTIAELTELESLDLGECMDFPKEFGEKILVKLTKLEKLRLEKGQGNCFTFEILEAVRSMPRLEQLELVNFDIKSGFDKALGACQNIKKLLLIPTYISQSATTNHMLLGGVVRLQNSLTHFVWGVTLELLRVTELFIDQCEEMEKKERKEVKSGGGAGDFIPVLKPTPLIREKDAEIPPAYDPPQVEIFHLTRLQKLLMMNLPTTRVKILKIPFHATWRQSITDSVN